MAGSGLLQKLSTADFVKFGAQGLGASLRARAVLRAVGSITVVSLEGRPLEFEFDEAWSSESLTDFIFLEQGSYSYLGESGWDRLEAQLIVVPNGLHRRVRLEEHWRCTILRVPRVSAHAFVYEPPDRIGVFQERSLLESALHAFAVTLLRNDDPISEKESRALEQMLLEMGGTVLLGRLGGGWTDDAPHAVLRDRAMSVIAQQCEDASLTPARVAREVQTSLRRLQLVFSSHGMTVAGEIRRVRARLAHRTLIDARYDSLSMDRVASRCGFGTAPSMRRALAEHYGMGPTELRRRRSSGEEQKPTRNGDGSYGRPVVRAAGCESDRP